ncbi:SDR family oxidoreductase [Bordetella genomosp. 9]|uniref:Short-chain dehydrogenase n=1 Tax=Bordetella genomosp. 9 TaxID=1416803 RepID=A0A1W6YZN3_9BORD|nr:SDR family oxidoreductase [Bordetella genomosp. 9]ARP86043.1 short-chain dehydrogenase [Bordetella genomosp. 9]
MANQSPFTVVLTGASSGIGRATALAFAREGASLVLAARDRDALESVAQSCQRAGASALAVPTDVTEPDQMLALADSAIETFGGIDVWINNVGTGAVGRFDEVPLKAHRRVIEANLLGHLYGSHVALRHFRQRGRGVLINMVSVGGWAATPYAASYAASKFALRGFSESLRAELSDMPGIAVCEVYPTFVDTPGLTHAANYSGRRLRPTLPMLDPRDVAAALVALARRPRPSTMLGSVAWPARLAHMVTPDLSARVARRLMDAGFRRAHPAAMTDGNLFAPSTGHRIDGGLPPQGRRLETLLKWGMAAMAGFALWRAVSRGDGR